MCVDKDGYCSYNIYNDLHRKRVHMRVTEVKIYSVKDGGRLKAYATVVFDDCFIVRDLKVIDGSKGLFVSMPSRRRKDGSYRDIAHPLNTDMRKDIEDLIISHFHQHSLGA